MLSIILQSGLPENWEWFYDIFADSGAWLLIYSGIMPLIWFLYGGVKNGWVRPRKGRENEWDRDKVSRTLKAIIYIGLIWGIILIGTGIVTMVLNIPPSYKFRDNVAYGADELLGITNGFDWLISISLLAIGVAMFMKPLIDVPFATIIGIGAGAVASLVLAIVIPQTVTDILSEYVNMKWVLLGVFFLVATIIGLIFKFWIGALEAVSKILSWPPVALLLAIYCFVEGFMVLLTGNTLIYLG